MNPKNSLCLLALLGASAYAQLDLGSLMTSSVRTGAPWGIYRNKIDSVRVETNIDHGVAVSMVRFTWTPSVRMASGMVCDTPVAGATKPRGCRQGNLLKEAQDSLESHVSMNFPAGSVVTGLWLWVEGTRVEGAIQEAGLARAQYNSIVGVRRDPALLTTWGGDNYNLQVFPLKSNESRTVELRVVQPIGTGGFEFPVTFRDGNATRSVDDTLAMGMLHATWKGKVDLELQGESARQSFGRKELRLHEVARLSRSRFTGADGSVWSGVQNGRGFVGGSFRAATADLVLEPAPQARLVVLDGSVGVDSLMRGRKLALLQIKQLMGEETPVQLLLRGEDGSLSKVFHDYVVPGHAQLLQAYRALSAWKPGPAAGWGAIGEMTAYSREGGVAVLLATGMPEETFSEVAPSYDGRGGMWDAWQVRQDAFYRALRLRNDSLAGVLGRAGMDLFAVTDNSWLQNLAVKSGGGALGTASVSPYWLAPRGDTGWTRISLYGPDRVVGNAGLVIDSVSGRGLDSLYWLQKTSWYTGSRMLVVDPCWAGDCYSRGQDSLVLDWAAQARPGKDGKVKVYGRLGGLGFAQSMDWSVVGRERNPEAGSLWARKRLDGRRDWSEPGLDWKVGGAYHFVTAGSSLLALEPGMRLWDSTDVANAPQVFFPTIDFQIAVSRPQVMVLRDMSYSDNDTLVVYRSSFDAATLESILAGRVTGIVTEKSASRSGLSVTGARTLRFALGEATSVGPVRIQDLQGRTVATLPMERDGTGYAATWQTAGGRRTLVARVMVDGKALSRTFQAGE